MMPLGNIAAAGLPSSSATLASSAPTGPRPPYRSHSSGFSSRAASSAMLCSSSPGLRGSEPGSHRVGVRERRAEPLLQGRLRLVVPAQSRLHPSSPPGAGARSPTACGVVDDRVRRTGVSVTRAFFHPSLGRAGRWRRVRGAVSLALDPAVAVPEVADDAADDRGRRSPRRLPRSAPATSLTETIVRGRRSPEACRRRCQAVPSQCSATGPVAAIDLAGCRPPTRRYGPSELIAERRRVGRMQVRRLHDAPVAGREMLDELVRRPGRPCRRLDPTAHTPESPATSTPRRVV